MRHRTLWNPGKGIMPKPAELIIVFPHLEVVMVYVHLTGNHCLHSILERGKSAVEV